MSRRELVRAKVCSIGFFAAICALAWLTLRHGATLSPKLADFPGWPVLFDLLLTAPALTWWLHRRDRPKAWRRAIGMAVLGVLAARCLMPDLFSDATRELLVFRMIVLATAAAIEGLLLTHVLRQLSRSGFVQTSEYALQRSVEKRFGTAAIGRALAFESRLWLYALAPRRRRWCYRGKQHFSYHLKDGYAVNLQGLFVLLLIGLPAQHFLLQLFSHSLAWVIDLLTLYSLLFLWAHYRASLRCPISLDDTNLYLRYGLKMREKIIPLVSIEAFESSGEPPIKRAIGLLNLAGSGSPNVRIFLTEPLPVEGLYGMIRPVSTIYLGLDQPGKFLKAIEALHFSFQQKNGDRELLMPSPSKI